MSLLRLGVLVSGRGSNLQAIIDAGKKGEIPAEVVVVISDQPDAFALERARANNIPAIYIGFQDFSNKEKYEEKVAAVLKQYMVEIVCLAGYMRVLGVNMLEAFPNRIMNIHPALLPAFPGLHAQARAWEHGVRFSGCTVHFVDEEVDTGPIILQAVVPVLAEDTAETLAARILEQEHKIYPAAIRLFAQNRLRIQGRKVYIKN
ncbi:phosphoribosylglycinamide formyltransferase [Peptococcaceae bacterium SCADC1_2_3]|nr:phosphoribosylglycinamide formyltransferase [Peptococcaceae bacterium SCADC1_2_3]KFI34919.1 phosphoribosylglycinamide formyltransferase [Peptococcaceae bacterium SCADC1_2_3]KFI38075.1 phosphoribosylglycinamide formyltransferase [Peptococcaceae bacterium SCADC1_2_3]